MNHVNCIGSCCDGIDRSRVAPLHTTIDTSPLPANFPYDKEPS